MGEVKAHRVINKYARLSQTLDVEAASNLQTKKALSERALMKDKVEMYRLSRYQVDQRNKHEPEK